MKIKLLLAFTFLLTNFLHAQHNHPGNLDSTFGVDGEATTAVNGHVSSGISDIRIQGDGKIIAGGYYYTKPISYSREYGGALGRYDAEGNLDNSFGINGIDTLVHSADSSISVSKVCFQSDGKIIALAEAADTLSSVSFIPLILRFFPNGSIDSSFGTNGRTFFSQSGSYNDYQISIEYDDKIIITGYPDTHGDYYLARLLANGSFDPSFGNNGSVSGQSFDYRIFDCGTVLKDGKILVGGELDYRLAFLARYKTNGTPDSTFGNNGVDTVAIPGSSNAIINSLAFQQDGKIIAAGGASYTVNNAYVNHNFISRYNINGGLDSSFAVNGIYADTTSAADSVGFVNVAVESDGKIVAGGGGYSSNAEGFFGLVRHLPNGNFDSSFGTNGIVITNTSSNKVATSMQLTNSRIYIAGSDDNPAEWAIDAYVNNANALPVTLLNFDGVIQNNEAILKWSTANELNNKGFEVEKSYDGQNFSDIAFVAGHGNSSNINDYNYTDIKVVSGSNYYRLQQIDNDGKFSYSSIIKLDYSKFDWSITGNPSNNMWVRLQLDKAATVSIQLVTLNGQIVQTIQKGNLIAGTYSVPLNLNNLSTGMYLVRLMVNDQRYSKKVIK